MQTLGVCVGGSIPPLLTTIKGNKMAKITFNTKLDKLFALSFELKKIMIKKNLLESKKQQKK